MKGTLDTILGQAHDRWENEPLWLTTVRKNAVEFIRKEGFPSLRHEDWKYTSLEEMYRAELLLPCRDEGSITKNDVDSTTLVKDNSCKFVFLNGRFVSNLSAILQDNKNIRVMRLPNLLEDNSYLIKNISEFKPTEAFSSLNTAFMQDGLFIESPENAVIDTPIHVLHIVDGEKNAIISPRLEIKAGTNSNLIIVEEFIDLSDHESFINALTFVEATEGSNVQHHRITNNRNSYHVGNLKCVVNKDASFTSSSLALGGKISRINIDVKLTEIGAACDLSGLFLGLQNEVIDHHTIINHMASNTFSDEIYKGVMGGNSKGVFNGKVIVQKDISGVKASQNSNNLLLSEVSDINTKPELEIYSDDVKCAHGATIGQLDTDSIFYLRTRGLSEKDAKNMLVEAFVDEALLNVPMKSVLKEVKGIIRSMNEQTR